MKTKIMKKIRNKKASGSIETSIKVITAVILGALILIGTYGIVNEVVLPATNDKVISLFEYSGEYNSSSFISNASILQVTIDEEIYSFEEGMTWGEWANSSYSQNKFVVLDNCVCLKNTTEHKIANFEGDSEPSGSAILADGIYTIN